MLKDYNHKYKSVFLIVPLVLLYRYDLIIRPEKTNESVGEVFLSHLFGGSYNLEKANLTISVVGLIGIIYLTLLFADYIICDLKQNAEYIFSRYSKRNSWYFKKLIQLFIYVNLGVGLYILPYVVNALWESNHTIGHKDIFAIICAYIMLVLFCYYLIIAINICALKYDVTIGFIVCYSIVIISSIVMIAIQQIDNVYMVDILHRINPMSNILVSWNFGDSNVLWSLVYNVMLIVAFTLYLGNRIKNYEIGISKKLYERK